MKKPTHPDVNSASRNAGY